MAKRRTRVSTYAIAVGVSTMTIYRWGRESKIDIEEEEGHKYVVLNDKSLNLLKDEKKRLEIVR